MKNLSEGSPRPVAPNVFTDTSVHGSDDEACLLIVDCWLLLTEGAT